METTATLLQLIREGDGAARDRLLRRLLPLLQHWASGRLPAAARDLVDTDDVVQMAITRALRHLDGFDSRHEGALLVYLRRAVLNQIRDQARRVNRRGEQVPVPEALATDETSPLENAIRAETLARYDAALETLTEQQRQAVVLRFEMGYTYPQVAEAVEAPSADAARMLVSRALVRLSEEMDESTGGGG